MPFEAITLAQEGKVLALGSAVFPLQEDSCYCIPFTVTSDIPVGACVLNLEQVQFTYHDEHQADFCRRLSQSCTAETSANTPDTSASPDLELTSLSAKVYKSVQDKEDTGMTVEEEVDRHSLDKMSIDTTFDLKQKIDLQHLTKTEANKITSIINDFSQVWAFCGALYWL